VWIRVLSPCRLTGLGRSGIDATRRLIGMDA
jgi:hypothetical protein